MSILLAILIAGAASAGPVKTIAGANLVGLGTVAENSNMKKATGSYFGGLGEAIQNEDNAVKTIVGYDFIGLGNTSSGWQDEWEQSVEESTSDESQEMQSEWGFNHSAGSFNFSEASTVVYIGETSIPLASYQAPFGKYLWIENYGALSEYASIPQYSSLWLVAYTSEGGQGEFLEMYPSNSANQGLYQKTLFNFNPGYNRIPYRGDVAGRHYLLFDLGDQPSNSIIIDVNGNGVATSQPVLGTTPSGGMT